MPEESLVEKKSSNATQPDVATGLVEAHGGESGPKLRERLIRENLSAESSIKKIEEAQNIEDLLAAIEELVELGALNPDEELQQMILQATASKARPRQGMIAQIKSKVSRSLRNKKPSKSTRRSGPQDLTLIPIELLRGTSMTTSSEAKQGVEAQESKRAQQGYGDANIEEDLDGPIEKALSELAEATAKEEKKEELANAEASAEEKKVVQEVFDKTGVYVDPNFRVLTEADRPQLIAEALRKRSPEEID